MSVIRTVLSLSLTAGCVFAQDAASPKFEVVSIRKIDRSQDPPAICFGQVPSPGRVTFCERVVQAIRQAYVTYGDGASAAGLPILVEKGPDWIDSEYYLFNARAEDAAPNAVMHGPMQRAMLEDRFKLKLHRETRQVPVYELVVGRNEAKLRQHQTADCTPPAFQTRESEAPPAPTPGQAEKPICRIISTRSTPGTVRFNAGYSSIDGLAGALYRNGNGLSDRPVVNKTGFKEVFDINLAVSDPTSVGTPDEPPAPSIFTAIEELGFKLVPGKAEQNVLIIDHIERPSEN